jgi:hypothetical protein
MQLSRLDYVQVVLYICDPFSLKSIRKLHIHAAMDRILAGTPQHSNGALTIVALALEAEVPAMPSPNATH